MNYSKISKTNEFQPSFEQQIKLCKNNSYAQNNRNK